MNNFFILIFSIFLSLMSAAEGTKICEDTISNVIQAIQVRNAPNYFFKVSKDGQTVFYASNAGNWALDLRTGKHYPIPGDQDVVPINEDILTVPTFGKLGEQANGLNFYSTQEILNQSTSANGKSKVAPIYSDPDMKGMYQSTGHISGDTYRVLTDENELTIKDYKINGHSVEPIQNSKKRICRNQGLLKLPMLSKNGKMVSVFDVVTQKTKVFLIKDDGTCEDMKINFPYGVAKADFSYDNKKIAFHIEASDRLTKTDYTKNIKTDRNAHKIMIFDLESKKFVEVLNKSGEHPYYPVFTGNGNLLVSSISQRNGRKTNSFLIVDSNGTKQRANAQTSLCKENTAQALIAIKALYSKICDNLNADKKLPSLDFILSKDMTYENCENLVRNKWNNNLNYLQKILNQKIQMDKTLVV